MQFEHKKPVRTFQLGKQDYILSSSTFSKLKKRFSFSPEPEFSEFLTKWKAPYVTSWYFSIFCALCVVNLCGLTWHNSQRCVRSVVFCWLRNERNRKHFSHTWLGVWAQVCGMFQVTWLARFQFFCHLPLPDLPSPPTCEVLVECVKWGKLFSTHFLCHCKTIVFLC